MQSSSRRTLWDLKVNESARVDGFVAGLEPLYEKRLCDLGLELGTQVICVRVAPFGGPKTYRIEDSIFSFDAELAAHVSVSKEDKEA